MKIDAIIKSGHNAINTDIHAIKSVSGHVSGQDETYCTNKGHFVGQAVLYSDSAMVNIGNKGHGSGNRCPDRTESNGLNGQSGQNLAIREKDVRYNVNDGNYIN